MTRKKDELIDLFKAIGAAVFLVLFTVGATALLKLIS